MSDAGAVRAAGLLPPDVLARELREMATQSGAAVGYHRGVEDTLRWLIGGGAGPLTGELVGLPIPAVAIVHELAAAEAVLAQPPGRCGRYASGVLQTLMWAQSVTHEPPHSAAIAARPDVARADSATSADISPHRLRTGCP